MGHFTSHLLLRSIVPTNTIAVAKVVQYPAAIDIGMLLALPVLDEYDSLIQVVLRT
jgi:hypothetical protein